MSTQASHFIYANSLGFAGGWAWQAIGGGKGSTEKVVHDYILNNPEILLQAMQRLQQNEQLQSWVGPRPHLE